MRKVSVHYAAMPDGAIALTEGLCMALADDPSFAVRQEVAKSMGVLGHSAGPEAASATLAALTKALAEDSSFSVREEAAKS